MSHRPSNRRGYVLVMTLGLITLAAISLSGLARYSLALTVEAQDAAEELQRRWGLLSARHIVMDRAGDTLAAQVRPDQAAIPPWPKPASMTTLTRLGSLQFTLLLADEDAKVSVNAVDARAPERLSAIVRHLGNGVGGLALRPRSKKSISDPVHSWGEVFDFANGSPEQSVSAPLLQIGRSLTCWGSGRLNLCRADEASLSEVAGLALSAKDVGALVSQRKSWGGGSVETLLAQLSLRQSELTAATRLFETDSQSYSLWVDVSNGQRTWSYQYVDDAGPACFAW